LKKLAFSEEGEFLSNVSTLVYLNIFDIHLGCGRKFHPITKPIATPIKRFIMIFPFCKKSIFY